MPYWLGLCVLRWTCRQNRLYETLFQTVIILSKHHHHRHVYISLYESKDIYFSLQVCMYVYIYIYIYIYMYILVSAP
jgi:hypothetical protein